MTFEAIFKLKRPKVQFREDNKNSVVLTKFQNMEVLIKFHVLPKMIPQSIHAAGLLGLDLVPNAVSNMIRA